MSKPLLYRWFGLGRMPAAERSSLEAEGLILFDEGLGASVTYRNYRAKGRRSNWKRSWFLGSLALTRSSFAAFAWSRSIGRVPLTDPRMKQVQVSCDRKDRLCLIVELGTLHADRSGIVELRFRTPLADQFLQHLKAHTA